MDKTRLFIDDSGDPGFQQTSSDHFVLSCIVIKTEIEYQKIKEQIINHLETCANWNSNYKLKFSKTKKQIIKSTIDAVKDYNYEIYGIILDKNHSR